MKKIIRYLTIVTLGLMDLKGMAQTKFETSTFTDQNGFKYETVSNDPLKARVYTLENGLKVYLTVYKDEPRIQTFVAVKAGSKFDPKDATGLAHYLEHIMFKGTSKIGTWDYEKEKILLAEIEELYQKYRSTTDAAKRTEIYHQIDSVSGVAAQYAVANEYDKLVGQIGASGTNAYTSFEKTVYINNIPSNQIEKWAEIEAERFSEVIPRLFHTELEAVYEEKNMGMDNDSRKMYEALFAGLFKKHQYGTQTTIGTIEHLKNPSITEIKKYFSQYYVANNMAICLSGDFNPDSTIKIIAEKFAKLPTKELVKYSAPVEDDFLEPTITEVVGPDAESVNLAFRLPGLDKKESLMIELISMLLYNQRAGLIDLNLNQQQKVMGAYSYPYRLNDYSMHILSAQPLENQTLEEAKDLLLIELDKIKKGEFDEWLIKAVVNDFELSEMKEFESNRRRADAFVTAFGANMSWLDYVIQMEQLRNYTKKDIVDFANKHYKNNCSIVYKRNGEDKNIVKVPKPTITPIDVNRDKQSEFYININKKETAAVEAVFVDYKKDIVFDKTKSGIEILYKKNDNNELFELYYSFDMGRLSDKKLSLAVNYLDYIGSSKYTAEELKQEFYKLGCSFDVSTNDDNIYVSLKGIQSNFEKGLRIFEEFLQNPKADQDAYKKLVDRILKGREDNKLNKKTILSKGLVNYAKYGEQSPYKFILSKEELESIKPEELCSITKELLSFEHRILFYGPAKEKDLLKKLNTFHDKGVKLKPVKKSIEFDPLEIDKNIIYFVDYDMVQNEVIFLSKSEKYDPAKEPMIKVFNEYFGGSMGSIVFQEMRESKALAYSVRSYYSTANKADEPNYVVSYIGTQSDKLFSAIDGMNSLLNEMPQSPESFQNAVLAIKNNVETNRITKSQVLFSYINAEKLGLDYDIRKNIYEKCSSVTLSEITQFQKQFMANQKQAILIIGSKNTLDFEKLATYGNIKELSLEQLFGY